MLDLREGIREIFLDAQRPVIERVAATYARFADYEKEHNRCWLRFEGVRLTIAQARVLVELQHDPSLARAMRRAKVSLFVKRALLFSLPEQRLATLERTGVRRLLRMTLTELGQRVALSAEEELRRGRRSSVQAG